MLIYIVIFSSNISAVKETFADFELYIHITQEQQGTQYLKRNLKLNGNLYKRESECVNVFGFVCLFVCLFVFVSFFLSFSFSFCLSFFLSFFLSQLLLRSHVCLFPHTCFCPRLHQRMGSIIQLS